MVEVIRQVIWSDFRDTNILFVLMGLEWPCSLLTRISRQIYRIFRQSLAFD